MMPKQKARLPSHALRLGKGARPWAGRTMLAILGGDLFFPKNPEDGSVTVPDAVCGLYMGGVIEDSSGLIPAPYCPPTKNDWMEFHGVPGGLQVLEKLAAHAHAIEMSGRLWAPDCSSGHSGGQALVRSSDPLAIPAKSQDAHVDGLGGTANKDLAPMHWACPQRSCRAFPDLFFSGVTRGPGTLRKMDLLRHHSRLANEGTSLRHQVHRTLARFHDRGIHDNGIFLCGGGGAMGADSG